MDKLKYSCLVPALLLLTNSHWFKKQINKERFKIDEAHSFPSENFYVIVFYNIVVKKYCSDIIVLLQIIYLKKTPEEAYRPLVAGSNPPFLPFR